MDSLEKRVYCSVTVYQIREIVQHCRSAFSGSRLLCHVLMDDTTLVEFAKTSHEYLQQLKAKNDDVKKILTSQEQFMTDYAPWSEMRGRATPWPYEDYVKGKLKQ